MNENIEFVKDNWRMFPLNTLYFTSCTNKLIMEDRDKIYLYSIHRVENVRIEELKINSLFFNFYKVISNDLNTTVGYVFEAVKQCKIRYTPVCITAVTPECTKEAVSNSEKKILYSDSIYVIWLSCNAEMVTVLPSILGIHPL
jgi:hypothetical protein